MMLTQQIPDGVAEVRPDPATSAELACNLSPQGTKRRKTVRNDQGLGGQRLVGPVGDLC